MPCLTDRYEEGGATKNEYFWQDLLVARSIYACAPLKHVDIGSRVYGFVAHVASFVKLMSSMSGRTVRLCRVSYFGRLT